ncbi:unnamed protein product [Closterium sp. NIES-64]|nr:unnamed protein product [Closterium sp. NIES-64]
MAGRIASNATLTTSTPAPPASRLHRPRLRLHHRRLRHLRSDCHRRPPTPASTTATSTPTPATTSTATPTPSGASTSTSTAPAGPTRSLAPLALARVASPARGRRRTDRLKTNEVGRTR